MASQPPPLTLNQILIDLCVLSYSDDEADPFETIAQQEAAIASDIANGLSQPGLAGWSVTWGPVLSPDIERTFMMYVAGNSASGDYAVVVRGTDPHSILGWLTDLEVDLVAAPYGTGVSIAEGVNNTLGWLNAMTSGGQSLVQYLTALPATAAVSVTGHSFGATAAAAYAPWLVAQGVAAPSVVTFAGPSAGDAAFAAYLTANVQSVTSFANTLDIVPNFWADILAVESYYAAPGPACPELVVDLLKAAASRIVGYAPLNGQSSLAGALQPNDTWTEEFSYQHSHTTYAALLGAPALSTDELEIQTYLAQTA